MTVRRNARRIAVSGVALLAVLATAACGGSDDGGSGSGSGGAAAADWTQTGPITYVQGKDTSGYVQPKIDEWNKLYPDQKVTLSELSDKADEQRQSMIENASTNGAKGYDVLSVDVVWTAEFAGNQYIQELPKDEFPTDGYLQPAVDSGTYFDKLYAFPSTSDGGMMYYRTDLLKQAGITEPPKTWAEVVTACDAVKKLPGQASTDCWGGQFQKYEGLTVNIAEFVNSAGGQFVTADGKPEVNSEAAVSGLTQMANWFEDGTIPKAAQTWQEEQSRNAFQGGNLLFLRNWPYVYSLASKDDGSSKVNGKFAVAPLPGKDGLGVSSLGGHNMGVTKTAKNLGTVKEFIKWWNSAESQKANTIKSSQAPTIEALYTDAELVKQFPYLPVLQQSIANAQPRPKAINYGDVTLAIQDSTYTAIQGSVEPKAAFDQLQTKLEGLLK